MIADKIKQYRTSRGYSQEKLAEKAGISLRTLQRLENGETDPRGDTFIRIAEALDVNLDELMDGLQQEDKTFLTLLHVSALSYLLFPLLGVVLPLVLWISRKNRVRDLDINGKKLLNFQITWNLLLFAGMIIYMAWYVYTMSTITDVSLSTFSRLTVPLYVFLGTLYIYNLGITVLNILKVGRGGRPWFRPSIRFLG